MSAKMEEGKELATYLVPLKGLIGASLSEPHTSVTALQDACVCPVQPTIYRIFKLHTILRTC